MGGEEPARPAVIGTRNRLSTDDSTTSWNSAVRDCREQVGVEPTSRTTRRMHSRLAAATRRYVAAPSSAGADLAYGAGLGEQSVNNSLPNTRQQQVLTGGQPDEEPPRTYTCVTLLTGGLL